MSVSDSFHKVLRMQNGEALLVALCGISPVRRLRRPIYRKFFLGLLHAPRKGARWSWLSKEYPTTDDFVRPARHYVERTRIKIMLDVKNARREIIFAV